MESLVGKRFGRQVVLRELGNDYVEIQCDCGTIKKSRKQYIKNGQSKSCGCGRYASRAGTEAIVVGQRFDKLVVAQILGTNGHKREVLTLCDCGNHKVVSEGDLRSGTTKSCGCFRRERMSNFNKSHGQGGKKRTVLYRAWESMHRRVREIHKYPSYGGRGIAVTPEWKSFEAFRDYCDANLGSRPDGYSLDRIDNDKNYEPGNIRWSNPKEQTRNRSSNVFLTARGQTRCLAEWEELTGVRVATIRARIRLGWPVEDAIYTQVQKTPGRKPK